MARILTFDQSSSKTGWAFGMDRSNERWLFGSFRVPKRDADGERLVIFRDDLIEKIEALKPDLVAYETPFSPVSTQGQEQGDRARFSIKVVRLLAKIEGVLEEACSRHDVPYESYASSTWRVTALGFGRLPKGSPDDFKTLMKRRARALGYEVKDDNEADAIGLLMHALHGAPGVARSQDDLLERAVATL